MLWTLLRRHGRRYRGAVAAVVVLQLISTLAMLYLELAGDGHSDD